MEYFSSGRHAVDGPTITGTLFLSNSSLDHVALFVAHPYASHEKYSSHGTKKWRTGLVLKIPFACLAQLAS